MSNEQTTAPKDKEEDKDAGKITFRAFWDAFNPGYLIAGLSSIALAWHSITRSYHKILHENKVNKDLFDPFAEAVRKHYAETAKTLPNQSPEALEATFSTAIKEGGISKAQKILHTILRKRDTAAGIEGTADMWQKVLKTHHKWDAGLKIATVTSIAFGALYSFVRSNAMTEKLHREIEEKNDQQQIGR